MVAIAAPVAQVADLASLSPAAQAAALGYPTTLFGFAPPDEAYWREPGLPLFTNELRQNPPVGYDGNPLLPFMSYLAGNDMAPRFPKDCGIYTVPVFEKQNLVVGRVYIYRYQNAETGELYWSIARLEKIGSNALWVKADNNPVPSIWPLRDNEREAVWDVREVTHYASYPAL